MTRYNNTQYTIDGKDLFLKLAEKVVRGELIVTHFNANMIPSMDREYDVRFGMDGFAIKTEVRARVRENGLGEIAPPVAAVMPVQVRELIFDEPARPVYDPELADE